MLPVPESRRPVLARLLDLAPRERITRVVGALADARVPRRLLRPFLRAYVRAYGVDLSEAVLPDAGFATFVEFFTRALRPGVRPLDPDPRAIVCPADGRITEVGPLDATHGFAVKGTVYQAADLLDDRAAARPYMAGSYAVVYLSPRDYHRVHAPIAAEVVRVRHIPGTLYPVNDFGVRHVPGLFTRNERVAVHLATAVGPVAVVFVGAMIVGRVPLAVPAPARPPIGGVATERAFAPGTGPRLERGAELGRFELGSTVVVLLPPGVVACAQAGDQARVGRAMAWPAATR